MSLIAEETAPNQSAQEYVQRLQFSVWIRRVVEASILLAAQRRFGENWKLKTQNSHSPLKGILSSRALSRTEI